MSPKRHLLSQDARTILDQLGVGLCYVDGGVVYMGDTEGGPYAPASMESVEEACDAVADGSAFQDASHRFEVFLETLDAGQGLDFLSATWASPMDESVASVVQLLGGPAPRDFLDDRTAELMRWEQIQVELSPRPGERPARPRASRRPR